MRRKVNRRMLPYPNRRVKRINFTGMKQLTLADTAAIIRSAYIKYAAGAERRRANSNQKGCQ